MKAKVLLFKGQKGKQDVYTAAEEGLNNFLASKELVFEQLIQSQSLSVESDGNDSIHLVYTVLYRDKMTYSLVAL